MTFENLLLIIAKVSLGFFLLLLLIKWFFIIPYLWFKYDKSIQNLKKELDNFRAKERKEAGGRGIVQSHLDNIIASKERLINEKLDLLETNRRLFIDRVNMILSIISINKHP